MSHPHRRESLLTQLENMHKQLNDETRKKSNHGDGGVVRGSVQGGSKTASGPISRVERNSMPMFACSSSHTGLLASNNSQDMTFVMGLSENLLVECRRLQAENETKTRKLKAVKQNWEETKEEHRKLSNTHQIAAKELQSLRDINWELEDKLKSLSVETNSLKERLNKNGRNLKQETEAAKQFKTELEVAELRLANLESQLDLAKHQHVVEVAELKKHVSELNDENDSLHLDKEALKNELKKKMDLETSGSETAGGGVEAKHPEHSGNDDLALELAATQEDLRWSAPVERIEGMTEELKKIGYAVVAAIDYQKTLNQAEEYENPSIEYLNSKVNGLGKQIISSEELTRVVSPPVSDTIKVLESKGYKVLQQAEHQENVKKIEKPTLEFLNAKLRLYGCSSLTNDELHQLREPNLSAITDNAKRLGYAVISDDLYRQIQGDLANPSLEFIKKLVQKSEIEEVLHWLAKQQDAILLDNEEFKKLDSCYRSPTKDFLNGKASLCGCQLIESDKLNEMIQILEDPSDDYLKQKAKARNLSVISSVRFSELTKIAEAPDYQFLLKNAKNLGYCLVQKDELETLERNTQSPELDFLRSKAKEREHTLIDIESHNILTQNTSQPSLTFLREKAAAQGYDLIDKSSHAEMQRKVTKPTKSDLTHLASSAGFLVVPVSEHEETEALLKRPPLKYLCEKAQEQSFSLIPTSELMELKNNQRDHGFVSIPVLELADLKRSSLEAASLSNLKNKLKDLGYVAVSMRDFERSQDSDLGSESEEYAVALCSKYNLVALPRKEYETLKVEADSKALLPIDHISALEAQEYVVLTPGSYDELRIQITSPSLDFLKENAQKIGFVLVPDDQHRQNLNTLNKPSTEFLREKASAVNLIIMKQAEIDELQHNLTSPSLEYLESKAQELGHRLISTQNYEEMERKLSRASLEEVDTLGSGERSMPISKKELPQYENRLENLSIHELRPILIKLGYTPVSVTEYDTLEREHSSPSEAYLAQKASAYDKLLVDKATYEASQQQLEKPSEQFLAQRAASLGKVLVSQSSYEKNMAMLATPSRELLEKKAAELGLLLFSAEEMESIKSSLELKNLLENPGFEFNPTAEDALNLKVRNESIKRYQNDKESGNDNPLGHKPVTEAIDRPQKILRALKTGSLVLLDKEEYQSLLNSCIKGISKREAVNVCSRFDMVAIPSEKYEQLLKEPSLEDIRSYAARHASVLVMREQFDMLQAQVESPSWEAIQRSADQKDMTLVKKSEYNSMITRFHSPTKLEVERQAEKLDMIAIPSERYERLLKDLESKSSSATPSPSSKVLASKQYFEQVIRNQNKQSDKLYEPTKTLGFVTLSNDEYKKLKENQKSHSLTKTDVYNGAKAFSLAVLPLEEYKALLKKKSVGNPLEYENLEEYAGRFNMRLIPLRLDSPTPCRKKSGEMDHGESLKFHDQASIATSDSFFSAKDGTSDDESLQTKNNELQLQATVSTTASSQFIDALSDNIRADQSDGDVSSVASTVRPHDNAPSSSIEEVRAKASTLGYGLVALPSHEQPLDHESEQVPHLVESSTSHDDSDLDDSSDLDERTLMKEAEKKDLILLPRVEYESYLAATTAPKTKEKIEEEATKLGLFVLKKEEYSELLHKSALDACRIKNIAPQFGLEVVKEGYIQGLKAQLADDRLTVDNVKARVSDLGYVALTASEFKKLEESARNESLKLTRELIEHEAPHFGLVVKPKIVEVEGQREAVATEQLTSTMPVQSAQVGPGSGDQDQVNDDKVDTMAEKEMPANLTVDDVVRWASAFKLVPIEMEQFEQIKEELSNPSLTNEEIIEQARRHGFVAIREDEYKQLKASSNDDLRGDQADRKLGPGTDDESNRDDSFDAAITDLKNIADRFELFRSPEEPSEDTKLNGARCVVVLSSVYYDDLLRKQKELAIKIAEEKIRSKDERLASIRLKNQLSQPPVMGGSRPDGQVSKGSKTPAKTTSANSPNKPFRVPKSVSHTAAFTSKHSRSPSLVTRNDSMASSSLGRTGSVGAISLATVASLSESSIIPALTQTVIGEYLLKYYPYLGPFGLNSRHERFFWVHPYTLTLYWSTTNPVLSNPSNHKTKCVAIVSVESVVDTNPYPAGLYHKSIIVNSESKKVKITCATRQRHNIWYNSLRYLIQRNMEGISLEDIADDPTDTMYSGKIFPLPGENSKSASQRLLSSRRSTRSRMPKSASVPIKENK